MNSLLAKGDIPTTNTLIKSVLNGVSDETWTEFVHALSTQDLSTISDSNSYGCFEMRPRRLADLGLMVELKRTKKGKREVYEGVFTTPLTKQKFLSNPIVQYNAFASSIEKFDANLPDVLPKGLSRSGALAVLHRAGPSALKAWERNKMPSTVAFLQRANKIF